MNKWREEGLEGGGEGKGGKGQIKIYYVQVSIPYNECYLYGYTSKIN